MMTVDQGSLLRRHPLASFFSLSFLIAWAVWVPAGLLAPEAAALVLPGAWAPTLAALIVTARAEGRLGQETRPGHV